MSEKSCNYQVLPNSATYIRSRRLGSMVTYNNCSMPGASYDAKKTTCALKDNNPTCYFPPRSRKRIDGKRIDDSNCPVALYMRGEITWEETNSRLEKLFAESVLATAVQNLPTIEQSS